jgi:hypothetical protein
MKPQSSILAALFCAISLLSSKVFSQDVTVVTPSSEAAEGLDLQAVAELFKDAKDLEEFEKSLNDAVDFTNAQTGWVVGDGGTILKTTNGGANWSVLNLPAPSLHAIYFNAAKND